MIFTLYIPCMVICVKSLKCYQYTFRGVKRSSYQLNSLILVAVLVGFVGTLLHVIHLDEDMPNSLTTTICNVR